MSRKYKKGTLLKVSAEELKSLMPNNANRLAGVAKQPQRGRIRRITESMKKFGFKKAFPIVINEDFVICDGHHRAEVACSLGIEGYVLVDPDAKVEDYAEMSAATNRWSVSDFVKAQVNNNSKGAQILEYLMNKFGFNPVLICRIEFERNLAISTIIEMITQDHLHFKNVNLIEEQCEHIAQCQALIPPKQDNIKMAIAQMMEHENYSKKRMLQKLKERGGEIYPSHNTGNYIEQLARVYNMNFRSGKIAF